MAYRRMRSKARYRRGRRSRGTRRKRYTTIGRGGYRM